MSTQVCWCTQTLCSVSLVKKRNTQLETMKVHICHISKPSWCVYHSQTHRSEKCGQLHTATRLATPQVICTYHKQLQAGCGLQRPDYHPSPSVAPWYTRSLCSTDHRHTCRLDAGHRNAFIPALQHSLVDQVAVQHLPQTHLQATEMRSSQHCNSPRYTRSLFCTYHKHIFRPQRWAHPNTATPPGIPGHCFALTTDTSAGHRDVVIPILPCSLVHQVTVQLLPQTYRQAGCRPQRCGHPHTAMLPGTPAHWTAALLYCNTHSYVLDECLEHCCSEKPVMTDGKWQQATATKYQLFMLKSLLTSLKIQWLEAADKQAHVYTRPVSGSLTCSSCTANWGCKWLLHHPGEWRDSAPSPGHWNSRSTFWSSMGMHSLDTTSLHGHYQSPMPRL